MAEIINWIQTKKTVVAIGVIAFILVITSFMPDKLPYDFADIPENVDFNYHVRPILSKKCFACHGPDSGARKADLRLDLYETATSRGKGGKYIIRPGNANKSLLIDRISSADPSFHMPPPESKKTLSSREKAILHRWIEQGAEWKPFWAFIQPVAPKLSGNLEGANSSKVIDYLLNKAYQRRGLVPGEKASASSLIRRLAYLLTGLPPTPEEFELFVTDDTAFDYEMMVDHYLASPHFGERWARHWMDLVRYAESMGHQFDFSIDQAWRYRDFLIRAFNLDVPYDLFVKEHLAGDLLESPRRNPRFDYNESVLGTAHFYLGEANNGAVDIKIEEANKMDNIIDVTSKTFLGLTVACARCHDHKFDPIPTTDYYSMYGMFESMRYGPVPARQTSKQEMAYEELIDLRKDIRREVAGMLTSQLKYSDIQNTRTQEFDLVGEDASGHVDFEYLGDFRDGTWDNWNSDGFAFGEKPMAGTPEFDRSSGRLNFLKSGYISSKSISNAIHGAFRSPNFIVDEDSLLIRARGSNCSIRLIVDNYQVVRDPLWSMLEKKVNRESWSDYVINTSLVKGHKAYIQFIPGHFQKGKPAWKSLDYKLEADDFIEVKYVLEFDGDTPEFPRSNIDEVELTEKQKQNAVADWIKRRATQKQIYYINHLIESQNIVCNDELQSLINCHDEIVRTLIDTTHFIGVIDAEAVFSPVFLRGNTNTPEEHKVPRRFLSAIEAGPHDFPQSGSGRLAWADSVVDPDNPLTVRVIVNRLWHHLFGRGIVETVDNFGMLGKMPSHPELLDYLAIQMIADGWSIKKMIRSILLTEAFQRTTLEVPANAEIDPDNIYLHHFPVRRLEAEAIRDGILAASGCLDLTLFGKPVPVHITEDMDAAGKPSISGPLNGDCRRSIYINLLRNFMSPMMVAFDLPTPFTTFGKRNTTNVPAQSLSLMNDPFVKQQSRFWAERVVNNSDQTIEEKISDIFIQAFARKPVQNEIAKAHEFLRRQAKTLGIKEEEMIHSPDIWVEYCRAIFNMKEFIHLL